MFTHMRRLLGYMGTSGRRRSQCRRMSGSHSMSCIQEVELEVELEDEEAGGVEYNMGDSDDGAIFSSLEVGSTCHCQGTIDF